MKLKLQQATSKINISFDLWQSSNDMEFCGVVAHWIDEHQQLKTALLSLPRIIGERTGEAIARIILNVLSFYEIESKVGCFQLDNASNNDTYIDTVALKIKHVKKLEHRLRCLGHVINLVVKATIFGEGLSKLQKDLAGASDNEDFDIWRKQGGIGKLHSLVKYINRTEARVNAFKVAQEACNALAEDSTYYKLVKDGGVRWNSIYYMICRGNKLEASIRFYCAKWKLAKTGDYNLTQDFLTEEDWQELRQFEELLEPFEWATKEMEGNANKPGYEGSHGAIWEVIPGFDFCFKKLQDAAIACELNKEATDYYSRGIYCGFLKLKEYYSLTDQSRTYRAAIALHPCLKHAYFEQHWEGRKGRIQCAKDTTKGLFTDYLNEQVEDSEQRSEPVPALETNYSADSSNNSKKRKQDRDKDFLAFFSAAGNVIPRVIPTPA